MNDLPALTCTLQMRCRGGPPVVSSGDRAQGASPSPPSHMQGTCALGKSFQVMLMPLLSTLW